MAPLELLTDPTGEFSSYPSDYAFYLMMHLVQRRQNQINAALEGLALDGSKWRPLAFIEMFGSCTMKDLARLTGADRTTLTRTVDRLVTEGYVERSGSADDRRQVILSLTPVGRTVLVAGLLTLAPINRRLFDGVPEAAQRSLCRTLEVVLRNVTGDAGLAEQLTHYQLRLPAGAEGLGRN